ncbi:MAG: TrmH family RNA methyltransferase [Pirellulales bacterium]
MADEQITSTANPRIKAAAALRERRERDARKQFLIDGARELSRALAAGIGIDEAYVCTPLCRSEESRAALAELDAAGITRIDVAERVFGRLAFGDRADGVVAVARMPDWSLATLELPENPLVAVVEGVEKPGNLGAILRTADAAGVSTVIVADGGTDLFNPNCIRASLGTLFAVPVCAAAVADVIALLRDRSLRLLTARLDAAVEYTQADFTGGAAIVLGSESHGLSDAWNAAGATSIRVPMLGIADSLNVSATAAVLFYEALRQRTAAARR